MSKINDVVQRAISDAAFRTQLRSDPAKALRGFNLSPEETRALTSGDPAKLTALGVDQRMSKFFHAGPDSHSLISTPDASGATHSALTSTTGASNAGSLSANYGDPIDALSTGDESATLVAPIVHNPYTDEFVVEGQADASFVLNPNSSAGGDSAFLESSAGDSANTGFVLNPNSSAGGDSAFLESSAGDSANAALSASPEDADAIPQFHSTGEADAPSTTSSGDEIVP